MGRQDTTVFVVQRSFSLLDGDCFLHPKTLILHEFLEDERTARYVGKVQEHCHNSTTREHCEADHDIR